MAKKWHNRDERWIKRYDAAFQRVRDQLGSYNRMAGDLYVLTGVHVTGQTLRRYVMERSLPLNWACSLVDLMEARGDKLDLTDFYPWLDEYMDMKFLA